MKKIRHGLFSMLIVSVSLLFVSQTLLAQNGITTPQPSQYASVTQRIGLTDITIIYYRPGVKERDIWGTLVPYDKVWRAGANENTTISFSDEVTVDGKKIPAGTYGLHMLPTKTTWTIIFSKNHTSWGSFSYDEAEDAARVTVTPVKGPHQEWLEFSFEDVTRNSAVAQLRWAELIVPFKIEVDVNAIVLQNIRNELRNLPGFTWQGWMQAANYCLQNDMNLDEGLQWADRSIGINKNVNNMGVKAQLLLKKGDNAAANAVMAEAWDFAKTTGQENDINSVGYMYLQSKQIKQAIDVFKYNVKKHPDAWNVYDSLGEGYAANEQKDLAIKNYQIALTKAPDNQKGRIEGILKTLQSEQTSSM